MSRTIYGVTRETLENASAELERRASAWGHRSAVPANAVVEEIREEASRAFGTDVLFVWHQPMNGGWKVEVQGINVLLFFVRAPTSADAHRVAMVTLRALSALEGK